MQTTREAKLLNDSLQTVALQALYRAPPVKLSLRCLPVNSP